MSTARCDALIVGGGPAGSSCARELTAAGLDVVVLDRKPFPRDKVCAGWVTPAVLEALRIDPADYACEAVIQPITGFRTGLIGGSPVETRYGKVVSYGIRRREFDEYLLRHSGARLELSQALDTVERGDGSWLVNGRFQAPLLIGAGGHFCPVARRLGAQPGQDERPVTAQEVEFEMTPEQAARCSVEPDIPELFFCPDLAGYGWVFRKGNWLNIGLGREGSGKLTGHVEAFCEFLTRRGVPEAASRFQGHAYLLSLQIRPRRVHDDGVLLVGDAAGLAYPQSGEGIRPAVESGLLAARTVAAAAGDYSAERLAPYARELARRFGRGERSASRMPTPLKQRAAHLLLGSRPFTRHVVLDRWFLHRHQAPLAAVS